MEPHECKTSAVALEPGSDAQEPTRKPGVQLLGRLVGRKKDTTATLQTTPNRLFTLKLLPVPLVTQVCIVLLFCINSFFFYSSLRTVTYHEEKLHGLEFVQNQYKSKGTQAIEEFSHNTPTTKSPVPLFIINEINQRGRQKSTYLTLVVITLVSFPFHIFGLVAVTKRSFTLSLTYAIISFVLLCVQLIPDLSTDMEDPHFLNLWFGQLALFSVIALYCLRLYWQKIRQVDLV